MERLCFVFALAYAAGCTINVPSSEKADPTQPPAEQMQATMVSAAMPADMAASAAAAPSSPAPARPAQPAPSPQPVRPSPPPPATARPDPRLFALWYFRDSDTCTELVDLSKASEFSRLVVCQVDAREFQLQSFHANFVATDNTMTLTPTASTCRDENPAMRMFSYYVSDDGRTLSLSNGKITVNLVNSALGAVPVPLPMGNDIEIRGCFEASGFVPGEWTLL